MADLHRGNVCFTALDVKDLSEAEIMSRLDPPNIVTTTRRDGGPLSPLVPRYTVEPSPFTQAGDDIKIIDFGQGMNSPTL